jgi:hypothetical protein
MFGQRLPPTAKLERRQFLTTKISSDHVAMGSNSGKQWSRQSSTTISTAESWTQGNIFQDIVTGSDAHQVIVSTQGIVIAKGVVAARGATQFLGQMSDTTLQKLEHGRSAEKQSPKTSEGKNPNQGKSLMSF